MPLTGRIAGLDTRPLAETSQSRSRSRSRGQRAAGSGQRPINGLALPAFCLPTRDSLPIKQPHGLL